MSGLPVGFDVSSAGDGLAARAAWEAQVGAVAARAWRRFLGDVETAAADGGGQVGWGAVVGAWAGLAVVVVDRVADLMGDASGRVEQVGPLGSPYPESPYLSATYGRLMESDAPRRVHAAVLVVASAAAGFAWSRARAARELGRVLDPRLGGPATLAVTGLDVAARGWAAAPGGLARDVATGAYARAVLDAIDVRGAGRKRWVTRRDDRVRPTHAAADGQTVPVGEPFIVGGWALMCPGDPAAPLVETAGCRCVLIAP